MLPNFLIAGGVATGTSFLSAALAHHPDIYLPKIQRPEPNFFHYSWKFEQGIDWYQKTWFSQVDDHKAIGERSSLMLPSDVAAKRIKLTIPDVKLIFCLRNPIERAWGNYRFTVLEGLEKFSFEAAIEIESDRMKEADGKWSEVQPHAYLTRSRYSESLLEYFDLFGRDNILLIKSENLGKKPQENLKRVCHFLQVDSSLDLPLPPNYSSPSVKNPLIQVGMRAYFNERYIDVIEYIRKEKDMSTLISCEKDRQKIDCLRENLTGGKQSLTSEARQKLKLLLADEIDKMKTIVDFPIDDWV